MRARFPPLRASRRSTWGRFGGPFFLSGASVKGVTMLLFVLKAAVSGLLVALISTIAKRYPGWGGLIASLPLVSLLSMLWLYGETRDGERVAQLSIGAFWFFLPSIPMFLIITKMLRSGVSFPVTMAVAIGVTILLYVAMNWVAPRTGIPL